MGDPGARPTATAQSSQVALAHVAEPTARKRYRAVTRAGLGAAVLGLDAAVVLAQGSASAGTGGRVSHRTQRHSCVGEQTTDVVRLRDRARPDLPVRSSRSTPVTRDRLGVTVGGPDDMAPGPMPKSPCASGIS